jgi:hypothetical protein
LLFEHTTYIHWPCSVLSFFSPPSSSSSSILSTCRDDNRTKRKVRNNVYNKNKFFVFRFSFFSHSLCWTISARIHLTHTYCRSLSRWPQNKNEHYVCAIFSINDRNKT